jgi:hexulose-6-phosphate isomerase
MNTIGIMQGRLLPMVNGRIQAFPGPGWQREFNLAAEIGFETIELTIEKESYEYHPVRTIDGRRELTALALDSGVQLAGLCCDTFMERPLVAEDAEIRREAAAMFLNLISDGAEAGLPMIEMPMLGDNSLRDGIAIEAFEEILDKALEMAASVGINILLETDLDAEPLAEFLSRHEHPNLGVNYDCGNSTYFGYDPGEEIGAYASYIRNVHVKDCTQADYSVPLGTGDTDFPTIFSALSSAGYQGGFILQASRQSNDRDTARDYYAFTSDLVHEHLPVPATTLN